MANIKMARKRLTKKTRTLMPTQTLPPRARRGGQAAKYRLHGKQGGAVQSALHLQCDCKKK